MTAAEEQVPPWALSDDEIVALARSVESTWLDGGAFTRDQLVAFRRIHGEHSHRLFRREVNHEAWMEFQLALLEHDGHGRHDERRGRGRPITVSSVLPERVRWLWQARIAVGKLNIIEGDPGLGKSTITLDLAARISTGSPMPDGSPALDGPRTVLLLSAEDGIADTIRPRLAAAGADLERVLVLDSIEERTERGPEERPVVLPDDLEIIEEIVVKYGVALVVIDPVAAFISGRVDSHKDADIRRALMPISKMAERTGAAVLVVRHLTKAGGANAVYRGGGSIGIIGAARAGLLVAPDPEDPSRNVVAVVKSNLAAKPTALAYRVVGDELHDCARIVWEGPTRHSANDLLATPRTEDDVDVEETSALAGAEQFLRDVLADGDLWVKEVKDEAKAAEVKWRTVERAKNRLGVEAVKVGRPGDTDQGWKWHLPKAANRPEGRQNPISKSAGQPEDGQDRQPREHLGHLRESATEPDLEEDEP